MVTVRNPNHDALVVRWALMPSNYPMQRVAFEILRSSSPTGPWDVIGEAEEGAFHYADYDVIDVTSYRNYYYIVRMADKFGAGYVDSKPQHLGHDPDGIALGMIRKKNVFLRAKSGVPMAVLVRKTWGAKCSRCWDPVTMLPTDADCTECLGTGFVGGYLNPVLVPGLGNKYVKSAADADSTIFEIANDPELSPKDIIVDRVNNKRYEVMSVQPTAHRMYTVCQLVTVTKIDGNSVVYNIPIPETLESKRGRSHDMVGDR
jgi:hypothetical protein